MIENNKSPSIIYTNSLYLLVALLMIFVGGWAQSKNLFIGLLINEYLIILLPVLLYLKSGGFNFKYVLRLNKISLKQIVYIVFIVIFSYPIAVFLNYIGLLILTKFSNVTANTVPIPTDVQELIVEFFIIALTPGICEEIMFRGLIMKSYEPLGKKKAILYSAILFGIFHFNLQNLLGPIILGLLFGILVYKTDSIFSSIIAHTVNNTIALLIGYFASNIDTSSSVAVMETNSVMDSILIGTISLGIIAFACYLIVRLLLKNMPSKINNKIDEDLILYSSDYININRKKMSVIESFPVILVLLIFIIYNYSYFFT